uniref:Uncharacterized protein n=1 Tax=Romanomermis culicivorax TaxID=13658 RepID=A0A915JZ60_ROMCU
MSSEKRRRENDEESWPKEMEKYEESRERKQEEKRDPKEHKDSRKSRKRLPFCALICPVLLAGRFDFCGDLERSAGDVANYNYFVLLFFTSRGITFEC